MIAASFCDFFNVSFASEMTGNRSAVSASVLVFARLYEKFEMFVEEHEDFRTKDLPLMQSPMTVFMIVAVYISFCVSWGPKLMDNRKAFNLKDTMLVYNAGSVTISVWMTYEALASGWWNDYNYRCQLMDYTDNPKAARMARLSYVYFVCKLIELLDTVFFVLRKKNNQTTFLHLWHHTTMPLCCYVMTKFLPGGQLTFAIMANSFIHSLMYSYYLLAGLGPRYQKYLWWKSHMTKMQLVQFVVVMMHQLQVFVTDCSFPKAIPLLQLGNVFVIFCMFWAFHARSYSKQKPSRRIISSKKSRTTEDASEYYVEFDLLKLKMG